MRCNVGGADRWIRIVLGAVLAGYGYTQMIWWLAVVGAVILLTGVFRFCCAYTLFGISTCKKEM
jgi:hypothetical protein